MRRTLSAAFSAVLLATLALPLPSLAAEVEGRYRIDGRNPGDTAGRYTGEVAVTRTGDTYQVAWIVGGQKSVGTGLRTGDILSVAYGTPQAGGLASPSIAVYQINPDGTLTGSFTLVGMKAKGLEAWTPAK